MLEEWMSVTVPKNKRMFPIVAYAILVYCSGHSASLSAQQTTDALSTKASLINAIQNWAALEINVQPHAIEVLADDPRLIVKPCDSEYRFSFPFSNQNTISASCNSPAWRLNLRIRVIEKKPGFVFVADYPAGKIIDQNDLEESLVELDAFESLETDDIVGRALSTAVKAGQRVRGSLLAETITQYRVLLDIDEGSIINSEAIEAIEARFRNIPLGSRLSQSDIEGAKAAEYITRGTVLSRSNLLIPQPAVFTTSLVARGSLISREVARELIHFGELPRDTIESLDDLGRATAIRQLAPGQPIRYSDIRPIAAISRGEIVKLTVRRGAVTVTIEMEAIEQGYIGDRIQLRNIESGRLVTATVTGPSSAARD